MKRVQSWGRLNNAVHHVVPLADPASAGSLMQGAGPALASGNGRSYGDVGLNPEGILWDTRALSRLIHWNEVTGELRCEAGVLLKDIQRTFLPRGWLLPVTPGTQLITVGGAIANDVHGKNHHLAGTFGHHVQGLTLVRSTGETLHCGPEHNHSMFYATIGGLGLTGVITTATLQLRRTLGPWLEVERIPFQGLSEFFDISDRSEGQWEHLVAWIDCLSGGHSLRGIFTRARPVDSNQKQPHQYKLRSMPLSPPVSLVNRLTLRAFNFGYYLSQRSKSARAVEHYERYLYPLDTMSDWNRMYGPRGFYQYQCVVPPAARLDAITAMLNKIRRSGKGSFLAVLKSFGNFPSRGLLSFPRSGVTLALDFPNQGNSTLRLFDHLDEIVFAAGGALYPAKDARMSSKMFSAGFPRLPDFLPLRDTGVSSSFSRRVLGF